MKDTKMTYFVSLFFTVSVFVGPLLLMTRGYSQIPSVKLITIRATVKDTSGLLVRGATIVVTDKHKDVVDNPDLVARFSGDTGQTYTRVPAVPATYSVTVYAHGYLPYTVQSVSGIHNSALTFSLKKKLKPNRPNSKNVKR